VLNENKIGMSNNFHVKLKNLDDIAILEQYAESLGLEILRQNQYRPLWFVIGSSKQHESSLKLSNVFYESDLFESADPDFVYYIKGRSNDPLFSNQWGLKNTGQHGIAYTGIDIK